MQCTTHTLLLSIVFVASNLLLNTALVLAAQAPLPHNFSLMTIEETAIPSVRDAVMVYEGRNPSSFASLVNCHLLQQNILQDINGIPIRWVVTPDNSCTASTTGKVFWWVETVNNRPEVLFTEQGNAIALIPNSVTRSVRQPDDVLVYRTLMLSVEQASRIPFRHESARCAYLWQWREGKYIRSRHIESTVMVDDPIAGGWVEMPLEHYLPDASTTLCQSLFP